MGNHTVPHSAPLTVHVPRDTHSHCAPVSPGAVITRSFFVSAAFNLSRSPDFLSPPASRQVTPFSVNTLRIPPSLPLPPIPPSPHPLSTWSFFLVNLVRASCASFVAPGLIRLTHCNSVYDRHVIAQVYALSVLRGIMTSDILIMSRVIILLD